jgi:5'-3' exonuclease, N-terminal resolvase-like domain
MTRYAVIDMNNLVNRAVHVVKTAPNHQEWIARSYMIVFQSIAKMANKFVADHCVACFDSYSWREEIYKTYKENRRKEVSEKKLETKKVSHMVLREFITYLQDRTNMTVLEGKGIEADDFVARFVQTHPDTLDSHVIISNDADFKQVVGPGIDLYDPIPSVLYTTDGVYYQDDIRDPMHPTAIRYAEHWKIRYHQPKTTLVYRTDWIKDNKGRKGSLLYPMTKYPNGAGYRLGDLIGRETQIRAIRIVGEPKGWEFLSDTQWLKFPVLTEKQPFLLHPDDRVRYVQTRETFNARWELFLKCIRGDSRDNIRASYPRVPETRLRKAFVDNNEMVKLINDSWGSSGERHPVKPLFEMNKRLIDLTAQPPDIIAEMDRIIAEATSQPAKQMVELYFDDFCDGYGMRKLKEARANILPILSRPYGGTG